MQTDLIARARGGDEEAFRHLVHRHQQPAFGVYARDPVTDVAHANGMLVLTLAGRLIRAMTRFDNSVLSLFGLPRTLPDHD